MVNILELTSNKARNNHWICIIPEHVEKAMYIPKLYISIYPLGMCPSLQMMRCSDPGRIVDGSPRVLEPGGSHHSHIQHQTCWMRDPQDAAINMLLKGFKSMDLNGYS